MTVRMQHRRGTAAQWTSANPVLAAGEIGVETDTLRAKIGNGSTAWTALTYFTLENGSVDTAKLADSAVTPAKLATTGRFVFPTGAANGYGFASGAVHLSGTGAPEGAVTAPPGSTWLQTDSTTDVKGWIRWIKATGTGNTGWVAGPEADTGLRLYSTGLTADWTGSVWLRRIGRMAVVSFNVTASGTGGSYNAITTVPDGWLSYQSSLYGAARNTTTDVGSPIRFALDSQSIALAGPIGNGEALAGSITYPVDTTWPASLPGSAA